ncbi:nucleoside hydrolase [uncultured Fibrella sp.]|uniref:nucleoside hydrolase n=1 Tax=uncultured Fibrella sp. TaxID=1284596 RepID=UPI0035C98967
MKKILLFLFLPTLLFAQSKPRRVWFDTDIMIGLPERAPREVDDGVTLIMALRQADKIELAGISTVTYVDYGYDVTQKILGWYNKTGKTIPVYKGSDSGSNTGVETDASRAMAAALRREKMPILALGPVTNVATVVKNHPELAAQIEEVVVCAGRTSGFPFRPGLEKATVGDYNFERDTLAFRVLFDAGIKVVLSGFECSAYLLLGKTDIDFLEKSSFDGDQWLYAQLRPWQGRAQSLFGVEGFIPYDVTPLGYLTHPEYFKYYRDIPVQINIKPNDSTIGSSVSRREKPFLDVSYEYKNTKWRALYAYKTLPGFEEIVIESLKK